MKKIYLDYASITPIDPRVQREINRLSQEPLNPSSIHSLGVKAKKVLDDSRRGVAEFLHAHGDEIIFTSGGTEANGLVLEGAGRSAFRSGNSKPHLIISAIEHSSIIETANMLEKHGIEVTRLVVDTNGLVSLEELRKAIKPSTYLVSIMTANNEIGTLQPIRDITKIVRDARKRFAEKVESKSAQADTSLEGAPQATAEDLSESLAKNSRTRRENVSAGAHKNCSIYPLFHTDACQAMLYNDLNVEKLGVDFLTLDASKAYGPRGVGALYIKRGSPIEQIMYGGGQENGLRSGTENIPAIAGFAKSLEIAAKENSRINEFQNYFEREVKAAFPKARINGEGALRSPHISNISFPVTDGEMLVLRLDAKGIACSTKSACLRDEDESYVLRAIDADSKSSVRFSFGRWTTKSDIQKTLDCLKRFIL